MKKLLCVILLSLGLPAIAQDEDRLAVISVLDSFHQAAAQGDWDTYFDLMTEQAVFLGTDARERWVRNEFEDYARRRSGWTYVPQQRNIDFSANGNSAWFDELLISENYGSSRGTGVLLLTPQGWKIAQYHLTFPIPNELVGEITAAIKAFEAR